MIFHVLPIIFDSMEIKNMENFEAYFLYFKL